MKRAAGAAEVVRPEIVGQEHDEVRRAIAARRPRGVRGCSCRLLRRIPPGIEARAEFGDDVGMDRGHVRRFIGIGHHVEEFDLAALVPPPRVRIDPLRFLRGQGAARTRRRRHDQLPAVTHRPAPEQAFRRVVEIDERVRVTLAEHLPAGGDGLVVEQVDAGQPRWWLDATRGEHGRHDVDGTCQGVARARLNRAGLPEHDRAAQAAVGGREFRTRCEPGRVRALNPTVVGDIHHKRVRRQVLTVEMIEQIADRAVEPLDVAPVPGHVDAVCLRGIVLDELRLGIVRVVRQHRRIPHEERFAGGS